MTKRSCGDCTKCCEGWLQGEALGYKFYSGRPCHFVAIGKGCSIYAKRPKEPCQTYKCAWIESDDIPEWMKPSEVNAIVDFRKTKNGIDYISINEAGAVLSAQVLTWAIQYALKNKKNLYWKVANGEHWIGSPEFDKDITLGSLPEVQENSTSKPLHQK